ncbi:hypothetical protein N9875_00375 [bacterium]|nr:hypothetical protein [bacterium]
MKFKMPKVKKPKMPSIPKVPKIPTPKIPNPVDVIVDTAKDVGDAVVDTANDVAKATSNAYTDSKKAVVHTTNVVAKNTEEAAKQGLDVASDTWKEGSKQAVAFAKEGLEVIEDVAEDIKEAAEDVGEWLDENACYIGLNMALTTGCVAYFTPKPAPADPGTVTSTTISATMLAAMVSVGQKAAVMIVSKEIGKLLADGIFLIPGVKGKVSKDLLTKILTNVVGKADPIYATAALSTPAGVGLFVGSVVSPIVATLVCEGLVPNGFSKLDN